jgi:hypothetical protein
MSDPTWGSKIVFGKVSSCHGSDTQGVGGAVGGVPVGQLRNGGVVASAFNGDVQAQARTTTSDRSGDDTPNLG